MCRECLLPGNLGGDIVRPQLADSRRWLPASAL